MRSPDAKTHLTHQAYAIVLAGGRGSRLHELTSWRAKPAVPFAGKLRIIDFALSNCVNSNFRRIGVLTQYKAQSLIRHIERGWSFLATTLGEFVDVVPAQQQYGARWYSGTANAVWQNMGILRDARPKYVLVLGGDHIYKMDYAVMLQEHVERGARLTVACVEVPLDEASDFGVMSIDDHDRVVAFHEKPAEPRPVPERPAHALASMGIYLFDADYLIEQLTRDAADPDSTHDFGRDIVPWAVAHGTVHAHRFARSCVNMVGDRPYWRDVGTIDAYWEANMDLTKVMPELNLYDDAWPILSLPPQLPPAKFVFDFADRHGIAADSLVASGCIVSGATVRRSVLFSKVRVEVDSVIEDSAVLPDVCVGRGVILRRAVIDSHCQLPDGFCAGVDADADRARGFRVTRRGVTLVTPEMLGQLNRGAGVGAEMISAYLQDAPEGGDDVATMVRLAV
ncbi:MAG: glucose-1-phosphate adenylyltransferase [Burkholderiales bacterium]|nr:glucose-1-phosphate adenylyltransferase [Burkholderiales bacterium]